MDEDLRKANIVIIEKELINDPLFDLAPDKHGHFLDKDGKIQEVTGLRVRVPLLDINAKTLFQMANFLDDMDATFTHPNVTIVIKEAGNNPSKIGVFSI